MPRRASKQVDVAIDDRGSGLGSAISRYPREFVGILTMGAAVCAVFANALFLQKGPHPAPIFATRPLLMAMRPAPAVEPNVLAPNGAVRSAAQVTADIQRELTRRGFYDGPSDGIWGAKTDAGIRDFLQAAGLKIDPQPNESLLGVIVASPVRDSRHAAAPEAVRNDPIAALIAPSARVLAIQRALSDFGYGQIKPTGTYDPDTKKAIEKFERDRSLPVSGQISDRFVRELAAMTGRPLE